MDAQERNLTGPGSEAGSGQSSIAQWWQTLPTGVQTWLMEHNGEHVPAALVGEMLNASGGRLDPTWWAGGDDDDVSQLTDAACDWIDELANGEHEERA